MNDLELVQERLRGDLCQEGFYEIFGDRVDLKELEKSSIERFLSGGVLKKGNVDRSAHPFVVHGLRYRLTGEHYECFDVCPGKAKKVYAASSKLGYAMMNDGKAICSLMAHNFFWCDDYGNFIWGDPVYSASPLIILRNKRYADEFQEGFLKRSELFEISLNILLLHEKLDIFEFNFILKFYFGIFNPVPLFGVSDIRDLKLGSPSDSTPPNIGELKRIRATLPLKQFRPLRGLSDFLLCGFKYFSPQNLKTAMKDPIFLSLHGYESFNREGNFLTIEFKRNGKS